MIAWVLAIALTAAQPSPKPRITTQRVKVESKLLNVQEKEHKATYSGNVKVNRGNVFITCDKMIAEFRDSIDDVSNIVCLGNVHMTDGEKRAQSQRADFDNVKEVLVLTGKPELHRGETIIRGTKITYHTEKDDLLVEDAVIISDTAKGSAALSGSGRDGGTRPKRDGGTPSKR